TGAMTDRIYTSIFYVALIVASSWTVITVGEALTREAITHLALLPSSDLRPSRVETYLTAQVHKTAPEAVKEPIIPAAPPLTVGALAKALDDAEQTNVGEMDAATPAPETPLPTHSAPLVGKPSVAGWIKRVPRRTLSISRHEETSNRIIMRALRAEM
nr:hypothetical protein [Hyphomicrobium sp.]